MNGGGGKVIGDILGGKANSDQNGQGIHSLKPPQNETKSKILETSCQSSSGIRLNIQNTEV